MQIFRELGTSNAQNTRDLSGY